MKKKDFEALGKRLITRMPGYECKGSLIFVAPIGSILRGIGFEGSSFDKNNFFVWAFAQPMYVLQEYFTFTLGWRLGGGGGQIWNAQAGNLEEQLAAAIEFEAMPFLSKVLSPLRLIDEVTKLPRMRTNTVRRAFAYSYARAGEIKKACVLFDETSKTLNPEIAWQKDEAEKTRALVETLKTDPVKAQAILQSNEEATVRNLKLEEFYRGPAKLDRI